MSSLPGMLGSEVFCMTYLNCSQSDCCHNKGGCCCLGNIQMHHTSAHNAKCASYACSEGYGNCATDNAPGSAETEIRCDDDACRHNKKKACCADLVGVSQGRTGPCCAAREE